MFARFYLCRSKICSQFLTHNVFAPLVATTNLQFVYEDIRLDETICVLKKCNKDPFIVCRPEQLDPILESISIKDWLAIDFIRDQRDLLISYYYAFLEGHPIEVSGTIFNEIDYWRKILSSLSKIDGLKKMIDDGLPFILRNYLTDRKEIYQDCVEKYFPSTNIDLWRRLLMRLKMSINPRRLKEILDKNSFESMVKIKPNHYREGVHNKESWKKHLTLDMVEQINTQYPEIMKLYN